MTTFRGDCFVLPSLTVYLTPPGILGNPMEGVGEDEKAYNYICNLDKINLGGPGWFNDVFKVQSVYLRFYALITRFPFRDVWCCRTEDAVVQPSPQAQQCRE